MTIGVPEKPSPVDPETNIRQSLIPVTPDMLYVSAIALGKPNLAIVNGRELSEGDWLAVRTQLGNASIQLTQIEDGMVRFRHGGETITAKLQAGARKTP